MKNIKNTALLEFVETLNTYNKVRQPLNAPTLLYIFYFAKYDEKAYQNLILDTFKEIQKQIQSKDSKDFNTNGSALIQSLEILDKNGRIETDLDNVLKEHTFELIKKLSKQRVDFNIAEHPFYITLLINRLRHSDTKNDRIRCLVIQIAEQLIQKIENNQSTVNLTALHHQVYVLIEIYKRNIYCNIIFKVLIKFVIKIENGSITEDGKNILFLNNLAIYPLACQIIGKKPKVDFQKYFSNCISNFDEIKINTDYTDKISLINSLVKINTKYIHNQWNDILKAVLLREIKHLSTDKFERNLVEKYLLGLTINSYLNPTNSSWDEILLVPSY